ncbi:MAG: hypothetical protein KF896_06100 [Ignavibacteriae bacterium]|nr:hypothetical protein [Ignavibacteriota bacterium]
METIAIPVKEYNSLITENKILKNQELLRKLNDVIDLMYESRYGLYLGNYTEDLSEFSINELKEWQVSGDFWNDL